MKNIHGRLLCFIKKDTVLCISFLSAFLSSLIIKPDGAYLKYIDYQVILLLFCLMLVVAGWQKSGLFEYAGKALCAETKNYKALSLSLCALCFFSSMFITNDVALITFVPFTIALYSDKDTDGLIHLIVFETIAANTGSMLTPTGNPQNLYLYALGNFSTVKFIACMFPLCAVSCVLLFTAVFAGKNKPLALNKSGNGNEHVLKNIKIWIYAGLFVLCMLCVFHIISYLVLAPVIVLSVFFADKSLFKQVDYKLLGTFAFFFVFSGNIGRIVPVKEELSLLINNREIILGAMLSQFISNMPAAMLLSGFTDRYSDLVRGVNIGGLGTLIASMASLISYKFYTGHSASDKKKYLKIFSVYNFAMLAILLAVAYILKFFSL